MHINPFACFKFNLDVPKSAVLFNGGVSYVEITNNGKLDARKSITILANVFPSGENGPIVAYDPYGNGVHLWQFDKTQLFVRFTTRESKGNFTLEPLATRVLQVCFRVDFIVYLFK